MDERVGRPLWYHRLHWKLLGIYALSTVPVMLVLYLILGGLMRDREVADARGELKVQAELIARMAHMASGGDAVNWDVFADALAAEPPRALEEPFRLTLLSRGGRILGDSVLSPESFAQYAAGAKHDEFLEALKKGRGSSERTSSLQRGAHLYEAVWVADRGVMVRVSRSREAHAALVEESGILLAAMLGAAFLVLLLASMITSRTVSKPMATLSGVARRISSGEKIPGYLVDRTDELGVLAASVQELSDQLTARYLQTQKDKVLLSTVLDGMAEGVVVCDTEGRVVLLNPAARTLLGFEEKNSRGLSLLEVYRSPQLKEAMDKAIHEGKAISKEMVLRRGDALYLSVAAAPIVQPGGISGAVAVFHNITTLRKLERIRKDFVANVSHELRTPLATITGYAETLLSGAVELDPTAADFIKTIERHAKRLGSLVSDLLVLARLEAEGERPQLRSVRLVDVVAEILDALDPIVGRRGVELDIDIEPEASSVLAESRALTQVLRNLVENGLNYTDSGAVKLRAKRLEGARVCIEVQDSGIGIEAQHLPRIFERFYRVDKGRSRDVGGTGLGLAIVKHMVQAIDGTIEVDSVPGEGTVFRVFLASGEA